MVISTALTIILLLLAYIVSVVIMFLIPYIWYKEESKKNQEERTLGGLFNYINKEIPLYIVVAIIPVINIVFISLMFIIGYIAMFFEWFFNKYLGNIKL